MASTVTTKIDLQITGTRGTAKDTGSETGNNSITVALAWASGSGTSQADEIWSHGDSIIATAFDNWQLDSLAQLDADDATIRTVVFANVKVLIVKNTTAAGTAGYLLLGGGTDNGSAADAWAGVDTAFATDASINTVIPGGAFVWVSPVGGTVTNTSKDVLSLGAITSTMTYEIICIGDK